MGPIRFLKSSVINTNGSLNFICRGLIWHWVKIVTYDLPANMFSAVLDYNYTRLLRISYSKQIVTYRIASVKSTRWRAVSLIHRLSNIFYLTLRILWNLRASPSEYVTEMLSRRIFQFTALGDNCLLIYRLVQAMSYLVHLKIGRLYTIDIRTACFELVSIIDIGMVILPLASYRSPSLYKYNEGDL